VWLVRRFVLGERPGPDEAGFLKRALAYSGLPRYLLRPFAKGIFAEERNLRDSTRCVAVGEETVGLEDPVAVCDFGRTTRTNAGTWGWLVGTTATCWWQQRLWPA